MSIVVSTFWLQAKGGTEQLILAIGGYTSFRYSSISFLGFHVS